MNNERAIERDNVVCMKLIKLANMGTLISRHHEPFPKHVTYHSHSLDRKVN